MTASQPTFPLKNRGRLLFWSGLGFFLSLIFLISDTLSGLEVQYLDLILLGQSCALIWALVRPVISWLGRMAPLNGARPIQAIAIHVPASLIFSFLLTVVMTLILIQVRRFSGHPTASFENLFAGMVYYFFLAKVVFYWTVVIADQARIYLMKYRDEELRAAQISEQLTKTRLQLLRGQMQPHFLFNTLHGIAGLIRVRLNEDALSTLLDLSKLLRVSLDQGNNELTPLEDEINLLDLYLSIERRRFEDRLRFRIDVPSDLDKQLIPHLLLQPLVENAIHHGIETDPDAGLVNVSAVREGERLRFLIEDDGPGLKDLWSFDRDAGIGLGNLRDRLAQLYGAEAHMLFEKRHPKGLAVVLLIPVRGEAS